MFLTDEQKERVAALKDLTVERLVEMSNEDFDQVVDDEIRRMNDGPEREALQRLLKDPAVAGRWEIALIALKKSVEGQLGYRRSDLQRARLAMENNPTEENRAFFDETRENFLRWKGSSLRFRNGIESRLDDVRKVHYMSNKAPKTLVEAIKGHKVKVLMEFPDDVSDADKELWDVAEHVGA